MSEHIADFEAPASKHESVSEDGFSSEDNSESESWDGDSSVDDNMDVENQLPSGNHSPQFSMGSARDAVRSPPLSPSESQSKNGFGQSAGAKSASSFTLRKLLFPLLIVVCLAGAGGLVYWVEKGRTGGKKQKSSNAAQSADETQPDSNPVNSVSTPSPGTDTVTGTVSSPADKGTEAGKEETGGTLGGPLRGILKSNTSNGTSNIKGEGVQKKVNFPEKEWETQESETASGDWEPKQRPKEQWPAWQSKIKPQCGPRWPGRLAKWAAVGLTVGYTCYLAYQGVQNLSHNADYRGNMCNSARFGPMSSSCAQYNPPPMAGSNADPFEGVAFP